jgi:hypothetical protein
MLDLVSVLWVRFSRTWALLRWFLLVLQAQRLRGDLKGVVVGSCAPEFR